MAHQVKVLAAEFDGRSCIPQSHMVGKNQLLQAALSRTPTHNAPPSPSKLKGIFKKWKGTGLGKREERDRNVCCKA